MKKVGYFFLCFLPIIIALLIQVILTIPFVGLGMMFEFAKCILSGTTIKMDTLFTNLMNLFSSQDFNSLVSVAFALSCIGIFSFWYVKQFQGILDLKKFPHSLIQPDILITLIFLVPGLQMASSLLTTITASFFPSAMEFYQKLMETAGLTGTPSFLLALYAVLLGPLGEELIFRGVVFSSAKKALPFWAANILQAILFGIFHLNLIQGIYAFFIGLFMGYVCQMGHSIYYSIALHIFFNAWGTFFPTDSPLLTNPILSLCFMFISIVIGIASFCAFRHNITHIKIKKEEQQF